MSSVLIILAVIAGAIASLLGFGHFAEYAADFGGWLALSLVLYLAASLPFDRYHRNHR